MSADRIKRLIADIAHVHYMTPDAVKEALARALSDPVRSADRIPADALTSDGMTSHTEDRPPIAPRPHSVRLSGIQACGRCGKSATGLASIGDVRLCHGDDDTEPTCYERQQWGSSADATPELLTDCAWDEISDPVRKEIRSRGRA